MGAYTWTFVRIDKLTPEMEEYLVKKAQNSAKWTTYGSYANKTWDEALADWLKMHEEEYDYFVNECGLDPKKLEKDYLTKQLKQKMKQHYNKMQCYEKCLAGEMTFEDMCKQTKQLNGHLHDIYIIKRQNHYYVHIEKEIFRNYEYGDEEFHTVDALIEHCRKQTGNQFMDYSEEEPEYKKWSQELEDKIREYYTSIGDDNFYVHFG